MTDQAQSTDQELRLKFYGETRADLLKRQLSNSENADRAILTVSTAALGFSLAFLKDVVPIQTADYSWLLYLSWVFFPAAIVATLLSFFTSQKAIAEQLDLAHKYYIEHDEGAANLQPEYASITELLNRAGAVLLVVGLLVTCIYVFINLGKGNVMSKIRANDGAIVPTMQNVARGLGVERRGANIPAMQTVPQSGAPVPTMQQVPQPAPVAPTATSGGSTGK
ncbi:MAG: hypothetical protein PXX73_06635 [Sideroxydans sp.]|nr:hypothetical protein [Sideroxydans sp.]